MLPDLVVAVFLATCLVVFYGANLYNLIRFRRCKKGAKHDAEVEVSREPLLALAAMGTFVLFIESAAYSVLVFLNLQNVLTDSWLQLHFLCESWVQAAGISLTALGYFLFIWSVLARGRYSTAWEMPESHRLVTWALPLCLPPIILGILHPLCGIVPSPPQRRGNCPAVGDSGVCSDNNH